MAPGGRGDEVSPGARNSSGCCSGLVDICSSRGSRTVRLCAGAHSGNPSFTPGISHIYSDRGGIVGSWRPGFSDYSRCSCADSLRPCSGSGPLAAQALAVGFSETDSRFVLSGRRPCTLSQLPGWFFSLSPGRIWNVLPQFSLHSFGMSLSDLLDLQLRMIFPVIFGFSHISTFFPRNW